MTNDFRLAAVAGHSNRALPWYYKITALWSGQEGSLLFWSWILGNYSMVAVLLNRERHRSMMPYAVATLMVIQGFFLYLNNFIANPFQLLAVNQGYAQLLLLSCIDEHSFHVPLPRYGGPGSLECALRSACGAGSSPGVQARGRRGRRALRHAD